LICVIENIWKESLLHSYSCFLSIFPTVGIAVTIHSDVNEKSYWEHATWRCSVRVGKQQLNILTH